MEAAIGVKTVAACFPDCEVKPRSYPGCDPEMAWSVVASSPPSVVVSQAAVKQRRVGWRPTSHRSGGRKQGRAPKTGRKIKAKATGESRGATRAIKDNNNNNKKQEEGKRKQREEEKKRGTDLDWFGWRVGRDPVPAEWLANNNNNNNDNNNNNSKTTTPTQNAFGSGPSGFDN
ncbi:hypothetical protein P168DRAFT_105187 [Aspergillus campestris IBT 28561]|uniref:Uncharacterized protein n=1 Tax=Aspergillus campestris (strain IBT 28561) TaxID=1392248 RepID=A0A2I1D8J7_ASPC2|nr:uncharacterized protein P168DRAFT_105187 [Aspergillus campestris IBT 28561]PKY06194.1 hypothetical protein P168DRAFT_105187 [Aspergillus campestris IBT 28561]